LFIIRIEERDRRILNRKHASTINLEGSEFGFPNSSPIFDESKSGDYIYIYIQTLFGNAHLSPPLLCREHGKCSLLIGGKKKVENINTRN